LSAAACFAAGTPQNFGEVQVNTSQKATLTYSFSGLAAVPAFELAWGRDFRIASPSCVVNATMYCKVTVTFNPIRPGVRQDALSIADQSGRILSTTLLQGVGTSALVVSYPGRISTLAGNGTWGYQDATDPANAEFRGPQGVALDGSGSVLYVADSSNCVIRKIVMASGEVTTIAGTGTMGFAGDAGPATRSQLNTPTGLTLDGAGNLYIADQGNNRIRRVDAITQIITTVAGGGTVISGSDNLGDGGPATNAILYGPQSVAVDGAGNLFIADSFNNLVRRVSATNGTITIVAGGGTAPGKDGFGNGELAINAQLSNPSGLALDIQGNVYIADSGNNLIRFVDLTTGIITAVAGNGQSGFGGDQGPAIAAALNQPQGVTVDAAGDLYIADFGNNVIRKVSGSSQNIFTLAGTRVAGYSGDNDLPGWARLANPTAVVVDENGDLFVADNGNNVIRQILYFPSPLAFGSEPIGMSSTPQIEIPTNVGNQSLTLANIFLSHGFQHVSSGSADCKVGSAIAAGASCNMAIRFTPDQLGVTTGSLTITTNSLGANTPLVIALAGTGLAESGPRLSLSGDSLVFGRQIVATASTARVVWLRNTSRSALTISSIALSGPQSADFKTSSTCGLSLAPAATCYVSVTFTPTAAGTRAATLSFSDNAAGSTQVVSLSGTAVGAPIASLTPGSLVFASQTVGTASMAQAITLNNTGGSTLTISSIALGGARSADFKTTTNCGSSLAPAATCYVSITFTPTAAGTRTATLSFSDNAAGSVQVVSLSGSAVGGAVTSLSPDSLVFGSQLIGTTSTERAVTLKNTGGSTLVISRIVLGGAQPADFKMTTTCGSLLAPAATCSVSVTFTPTAPGNSTASLSFSDNASAPAQVVSLTGIGVSAPSVSLSPGSLIFGNQIVGTLSAPKGITLRNTSGVTVTILGIALGGPQSADFKMTTTCGSSLAPGTDCYVWVTFTPTAVGTRTATLSFTDNAAGSTQIVSLSGTAVGAPIASLTPGSLVFASQTVGTTSTAQAITLNNTGGSTLTISSIALGGPQSADFKTSSTCGSSLAPAATCSVSVTFTPTATGTRTATLSFTDNAAGSTQVVSLSGTAVGAPIASLTPGSLVFASQTVGTASTAQAITLNNMGGSTLTISNIALGGPQSADFQLTANNCGSSLAPAATCSVSVTFTPTATGTRTATLSFTDNAAGSTQVVSLSGAVGGDPVFSLTPNPLSFGNVPVGRVSQPQTLTLNNTGGNSMVISSIVLNGAQSDEFEIVTACGSSLAPGGTCVISVTFTPRSIGTANASIIVSDGSGNPEAAMQFTGLTGTGLAMVN
jgi:sugar lactone lactonase YvrE